MVKPKDYFRDEKSASGRQLVLMFLAAVAVCAVFFSLGFVVGYNRAPSKGALAAEGVSPSGEIPPTVNPPAGSSDAGGSPQSMQTENVSPTSNSVPPPERPQTLAPQPAEQEQPAAVKVPKKLAPKVVAKNKPAPVPQNRSATSVPTASSAHFAVQVMASSTRADAENLVNLLKSRGYPVYVLTPEQASSRDKLYRVQVGPFVTRIAADTTRDKLEGDGFRPFVVH